MTDDADDPINDEDKFDEAIARLGARYFPTDHPYGRQRNYLRYHLFIMDMQLCDFKAELLRQNNYLRYFPVPEDRESVVLENWQDLVCLQMPPSGSILGAWRPALRTPIYVP